jgi:hypothetical protein
MKILFTDTMGVHPDYLPKPADKFIPEWYKEMDSYDNGKKDTDGFGKTNGTIKKCMPVFDSITAGYIIPTYVDVAVRQGEKPNVIYDGPIDISGINSQPHYESPSYKTLGVHKIEQAPTHPFRGNHVLSYPKWFNPWAIKTPPGYSTLFIQPMHRESVFTIMPGVVDTDKYTAPVNFPFVLNNADKFEGVIPAGTPLAQAIPFRRDSWEMEFGTIEDFNESVMVNQKIFTKVFDAYKTDFRQKKEYK